MSESSKVTLWWHLCSLHDVIYLCTDAIRNRRISLLCVKFVCYVCSRLRKTLSWWLFFDIFECKILLVYARINTSSLIFRMLSVDSIMFSFSLIQSSHLLLWTLYFLALAMIFNFIWGLLILPHFNIHITFERGVADFILFFISE